MSRTKIKNRKDGEIKMAKKKKVAKKKTAKKKKKR